MHQQMSDSEESGSEDALPFRWMEGDSLAPPCQSESDVIRDVLELASPTPGDVTDRCNRQCVHCGGDCMGVMGCGVRVCFCDWQVLFDLGCGDGRICIAATEKYGARSCGTTA